MTESVLISTANFTKIIGQFKQFPYSLFDTFKGAIYTPWDKSTLFQDVAMTQVVTTVGQPVRAIKDVSGLGNHLLSITTESFATYQEVEGKGVVRFNGTSSGFNIASSGLSIFSSIESAMFIAELNLDGISTYKTVFQANTESNDQRFKLGTADNASNIVLSGRVLTGQAAATATLAKASGRALYSNLINYKDGAMNTKIGTSSASANLSASGVTSGNASNGIFFGNYNSTAYAAMDFHGGIIITGASSLNQHRADLENWLINQI